MAWVFSPSNRLRSCTIYLSQYFFRLDHITRKGIFFERSCFKASLLLYLDFDKSTELANSKHIIFESFFWTFFSYIRVSCIWIYLHDTLAKNTKIKCNWKIILFQYVICKYTMDPTYIITLHFRWFHVNYRKTLNRYNPTDLKNNNRLHFIQIILRNTLSSLQDLP